MLITFVLICRIWEEVCPDQPLVIAQDSLRTNSSASPALPFTRIDPFHPEIKNQSALMNEVAVVQDEKETWSDVSV